MAKGCCSNIGLKLGLLFICVLVFVFCVKVTVSTRDMPSVEAAAFKVFFEGKMAQLNTSIAYAIENQNQTFADTALGQAKKDFTARAYSIYQQYDDTPAVMLGWFVFALVFATALFLALCY